MDFHLPDVYDPSHTNLDYAKEQFLVQHQKLAAQRLLHCLIIEFKSQPHLTEVTLDAFDEGKEFDAHLKFSPDFNVEESTNYWEAKSIENSIMASYIPELAEFCKAKTIKREAVLNDDGTLRYADVRDLLVDLQLN